MRVDVEKLLKLLTEQEAADLLTVSPGTLSVWRCTRRYDLRYLKIGRAVRYRESDILEFIASRESKPNLLERAL
jgi:predicted DNA-binding transcriptional regulator AlpA